VCAIGIGVYTRLRLIIAKRRANDGKFQLGRICIIYRAEVHESIVLVVIIRCDGKMSSDSICHTV